MEGAMDAIIAEVSTTLAAEDAVRAKLSGLRDKADGAVRFVQRLVGTLHVSVDLGPATDRAMQALPHIGSALLAIENALPMTDGGAYYRYNEIWRRTLQNAVCVCIVTRFAKDDCLSNRGTVLDMLEAEKLTLPLEDYLVGAIGAVSELARLCMNRVVLGDFETPGRCAMFANCMFEGFKELNFRNDFLRKRYDGMKYDVKRIEEIMYDLSIRGLIKQQGANVVQDKSKMEVGGTGNSTDAADAAVAKSATRNDAMGNTGGPNPTDAVMKSNDGHLPSVPNE